MKKVYFIFVFFISLSLSVICQDLRRETITSEDSTHGILSKYLFESKDSYGNVSLILRKDSTYNYRLSKFAIESLSEGRWALISNHIILNSVLQGDDIPLEISYGPNGEFVDGFNIAVVKNKSGKLLTEAFVLVNIDSVKCLPPIGQCNNSFETIKRLKVTFENGLSSKWICVEEGYDRILLRVLSDISIENFVVMKNVRFEIEGDVLKEVQ